MKKNWLLNGIFFWFLIPSYAQQENTSSLSIKEIMQGDDFVGHLPSNPQWSLDSQILYFDWNPEKAQNDSLYAYHLKSAETVKTNFETSYSLPSSDGVFNRDRSLKLYSKRGDLFLLNLKTKVPIQITQTETYESAPHFTGNETKVAYRRGDHLFSWDIATGSTVQLTKIISAKSDDEKSKKDQWLYEDQLGLFEVLRERKDKKDKTEEANKRVEAKGPLPIEPEGKSIYHQSIDPIGNYITYIAAKSPSNKGTIVPHYVTESGYTENEDTRAKVGNEPYEYEMFVYDIAQRKVYPVVLDNLEGLDYVPEYSKDYPDKTYENKNRLGYIDGPLWSEDGKYAVLDINSNDYKDRWIVLLDPKDGTVTQLDRQHDEAWIAGPGIGGYEGGEMGWMPDGKSIWFQSEKTGYSHLYTIDIITGKTNALTSGKYEIYGPQISKDKKRWYFTANKNHPGDRQFYSMPINGGDMQQLTRMSGSNEVTLSPDERKMAILHSYSNKPTELYLQDNPVWGKSRAETERITHSTTKDFNGYEWRDPQIITFKAQDGQAVHARLYQPSSDIKNKAAIIFVHGAGYLQNAHKWWSSYFREYMFHNLLTDNGYTVLDIDYRGSAGYGRDWRTGIYRHMGGKDLSDQVDGAKYLIDELGIDQDKIGIYGGSYGGFITLMAMFKAADTFKAGAAIRSVGDWAAYNHGYTARILNTPVTDSLAYRRSSPIYFAEGLKGNLLILHGMVDDNVHFQDMVRLSQRLIELEKHHWEMAVYPVERHSFVEPSSWTDEYSRIFKLFQNSLLDKE